MSTGKSDFSFEAVIERIKAVLGLRFDTEVAASLKMDRRTLAGYKSRGTLPYEALVEMAAEKGLSLEWLVFGRGPQETETLAIAEPAAHYAETQIAKIVRGIMAAEGFEFDKEKTDYLIRYVYDETMKSGGEVDEHKVAELIKIIGG